jgi:transcriptional regulator with XRE-family HTH domain
MKQSINIRVGKNIRKLRETLGLSQDALSDLAGVHRTYIGMVERAERNITLVSLEKISKALRVSMKDLL